MMAAGYGGAPDISIHAPREGGDSENGKETDVL